MAQLTQVIMVAAGHAFGSVKKEDFDKFVKSFLPKIPMNVEDTVKKLKEFNIPIEEK